MDICTTNLLSLDKSIAGDFLKDYEIPYMALPYIGDIIRKLFSKLDMNLFEKRAEDVFIASTAKIDPNVIIRGPVIIDDGAEIRSSAYIRGNALVGKDAVVGNSTELKNVILFDNVQVPHYNYIGDSILGYKAHMGAGSITSNVKQDKKNIILKNADEIIETGLRKFGAILGDNVEVGCNAVLNPGTIVGKNTNIYPLSMVRGLIPSESIYKSKDDIVIRT